MIKINIKRGIRRIGFVITGIILIITVAIAMDSKNWLEVMSVGIGLVLVGWVLLFAGFWIADGFSGGMD